MRPSDEKFMDNIDKGKKDNPKLVQKPIVDSRGVRRMMWVDPNKDQQAPQKEKKQDEPKKVRTKKEEEPTKETSNKEVDSSVGDESDFSNFFRRVSSQTNCCSSTISRIESSFC